MNDSLTAPPGQEAEAVTWHAEVVTSLGEGNTGHCAVSFAAATLDALIARICAEMPENYGFSVYRSDTGHIYPSALYQEFVPVVLEPSRA